MAAVSDLGEMIATMEPVLRPGTYVFATVPPGVTVEPQAVIASIREPEGLSVVMEAGEAEKLGLSAVFRCAWISLSVHSALDAVGLTAAFSTALANAGLSCNVVAGAHHDHIFVPVDRAEKAMAALRALQGSAGGSEP